MSGLMNRRTALAGLAGLSAMTSCAIPGISGLDTSWVTNKQVGLKYVSGSAAQTLDLYLPNGATPPHPVIVAIHGGGFAMGSANSGEVAPMVQGAKRGYAVACVNYRLSGEARFPAAVADCRSAVRYLRANAAKLGVNPDRFAAWGASAGGNLAAMLGTAAAATDLDGDPREAAVRQAELDMQFTELRAPVAGRIGDRRVSPGNLVTGGSSGGTTMLAMIVSIDPIRFEFTFDESAYLRYERFAGGGKEVTGCEGYVESAAVGLMAGRFAAAEWLGEEPRVPPHTTAHGALIAYITGDHIDMVDSGTASYQPMNINFGLLPPIHELPTHGPDGKKLRGPDKANVKKIAALA